MPLPLPLLLALNGAPDAGPTEQAIAPAAGIAMISAGVWLGLVAGQEEHAPKQCNFCTASPAEEAARDAIIWKNIKLASKLSDAFLGITTAWALGSLGGSAAADHRLNAVDPLLVVESTALAMAVNQIVKMEVARKRPDAPGEKSKPHPQHNMSFFSGHATWSFSSAVSAGTVALLRGYRGAPAVLGGGLALATATSYFRLAANRHWISDVITGAAFGSLVGALVPRLHLVPGGTSSSSSSSAATGGPMPTMFTMGGGF